ncbi:MAG: hypothetical protein Q4G04_05805 [bacterium]|nr:hypothetical protein [bacterium]
MIITSKITTPAPARPIYIASHPAPHSSWCPQLNTRRIIIIITNITIISNIYDILAIIACLDGGGGKKIL